MAYLVAMFRSISDWSRAWKATPSTPSPNVSASVTKPKSNNILWTRSKTDTESNMWGLRTCSHPCRIYIGMCEGRGALCVTYVWIYIYILLGTHIEYPALWYWIQIWISDLHEVSFSSQRYTQTYCNALYWCMNYVILRFYTYELWCPISCRSRRENAAISRCYGENSKYLILILFPQSKEIYRGNSNLKCSLFIYLNINLLK
jgi:hypothetical protein